MFLVSFPQNRQYITEIKDKKDETMFKMLPLNIENTFHISRGSNTKFVKVIPFYGHKCLSPYPTWQPTQYTVKTLECYDTRRCLQQEVTQGFVDINKQKKPLNTF